MSGAGRLHIAGLRGRNGPQMPPNDGYLLHLASSVGLLWSLTGHVVASTSTMREALILCGLRNAVRYQNKEEGLIMLPGGAITISTQLFLRVETPDGVASTFKSGPVFRQM